MPLIIGYKPDKRGVAQQVIDALDNYNPQKPEEDIYNLPFCAV